MAQSKDYQFPLTDEEWLVLEDFKLVDIPTTAGPLKGVLVEPVVKTDHTVTVMSGGIPRRAAEGEHIPLLGSFFGDLARRLRDGGSTSLLYLQPGINEMAGRVGDLTTGDRIALAQEICQWAQATTGSEHTNLLSTSMGAYIALRAGYGLLEKDTLIQQLILISPAAYPYSIESVALGDSFKQYASISWEWSETVIDQNLRGYLKAGGRLLFYAYEYDDPPIPMFIQARYEKIVSEAQAVGYHATSSIIAGVKHSFRRLDSPLSEVIIDDTAVVRTADQMANAILAHNQ